MNWLDCDNEVKMNSFIERFDDEIALRRFAISNADSVSNLLVDSRSRDAVIAAKGILNGSITEEELRKAYTLAESACEDLELAELSSDLMSDKEENCEYYSALVAMWVAYPISQTEILPLQCAQDSALHTAFYCFKIYGHGALVNQVVSLKSLGLIR